MFEDEVSCEVSRHWRDNWKHFHWLADWM